MKTRKISDTLKDQLISGKYEHLWKAIIRDNTLVPVLRGNQVDIYYRGHKCFSIFNTNITVNRKFRNTVKIYDVVENPSNELFLEQLPYYKQNIDFWFGEAKSPYEREFSQVVFRENNSEKIGRYTDYFLLDMEYQYEYVNNGLTKKPEPDLMAVQFLRNERGRKVNHRLAIVEVKYGDGAYNGKAGIRSHIDDYIYLLNHPELIDKIKNDLVGMFSQEKELKILPGLMETFHELKFSKEKPQLILALISHNSNSGKSVRDGDDLKTTLQKAIEEYEDLLDEVYIASSSEMGFGLYEDRLIPIRKYINNY